MKCPRCSHDRAQEIEFNHKREKVVFTALICRRCQFIYAEDKEKLKAARKFMLFLSKEKSWDKTYLPNSSSQEKNSTT